MTLSALLASRPPRERMLLAVMGLVLSGAALWIVAVQPLRARTVALEAQVQRHGLALSRVAVLPPPATAVEREADDRALPVIVAETAQEAGLELRRLDERGGAVSARIDAAPFDAAMLWIETLEARLGLRLTDVTMVRLDTPGTVALTLEVTR